MKPHITHLFMEVGDLAKARWFWVEAVGLDLLEDRGPYIRVGGDVGAAIGIEQAQLGQVSAAGPEIVVRVADADEASRRLCDAGVVIRQGPEDMPWGARHVWVHDPDGRSVSLYSQ